MPLEKIDIKAARVYWDARPGDVIHRGTGNWRVLDTFSDRVRLERSGIIEWARYEELADVGAYYVGMMHVLLPDGSYHR